jgi:hypothetical protein
MYNTDMGHEEYLDKINQAFEKFKQHPAGALFVRVVDPDIAKAIFLNGAHAAKDILEGKDS